MDLKALKWLKLSSGSKAVKYEDGWSLCVFVCTWAVKALISGGATPFLPFTSREHVEQQNVSLPLCGGERGAAPRCIPSACEQPKHLVKSESGAKTEPLHQSNFLSDCLSVIPPFTAHLIIISSQLPPLCPSGHTCGDWSEGSSLI